MGEWHTPIACLVMCDERDAQVLCVTYGLNGMQSGDVDLFGGDYTRASKRNMIFDPFMASQRRWYGSISSSWNCDDWYPSRQYSHV